MQSDDPIFSVQEGEYLNSKHFRQSNSNAAHVVMRRDGVLRVQQGPVNGLGRILWESQPRQEVQKAGPYTANLQLDTNLVITTSAEDISDPVVWDSGTVSEEHRTYYFGLNCDATAVFVGKLTDNYKRVIVWSQDVFPPNTPPDPLVLIQGKEIIKYSDSSIFDSIENCEFAFRGDGSFTLRRKYLLSNSHRIWNTPGQREQDGRHIIGLNQENGSMEIYFIDENGNKQIDYTTNMPDPELSLPGVEKSFELQLMSECVLAVVQAGKHVIWSSNRDRAINSKDPYFNVLNRGDMFHVDACTGDDENANPCPQTLFLQNDCNLIQFFGVDPLDLAIHRTVMWSSGTVDERNPYWYDVDCYLFADENHLRLYNGTLDRTNLPSHSGEILWEATAEEYSGCTVGLKAEGGLFGTCS